MLMTGGVGTVMLGEGGLPVVGCFVQAVPVDHLHDVQLSLVWVAALCDIVRTGNVERRRQTMEHRREQRGVSKLDQSRNDAHND